MNIRFLLPAEIEMNEASLFYEMRAPGLGKNFLDIIETAVSEIAEQPEIWPEIDKGIRRRLVRRFPYSLLYSIQSSEIIIVAVMHQKQKPRYWIDRL
jgi:plasmid stabilization system protein ParE